jgi:ankyrin repeat protein
MANFLAELGAVVSALEDGDDVRGAAAVRELGPIPAVQAVKALVLACTSAARPRDGGSASVSAPSSEAGTVGLVAHADAAALPSAATAQSYMVRTRQRTQCCEETALALLALPGVGDMAHDFSNRVLGIAATRGCARVVTALLALPRVAAGVDARHQYALRGAAEAGNLEIVNTLLALPQVRRGAAAMYNHALITAAFGGGEDVALRLLEVPDVAAQAASLGNLALRYAVERCMLRLTRELLRLPHVAADAAGRCNEALREAAASGNGDTLELLLAVPQVRERAAWPRNTALACACSKGHLTTVERLLREPAVLAAVTIDLSLPLRRAAETGHALVVRRLLEIPAVRGDPSIGGLCALQEAAVGGHGDVVRALLAVPCIRDAAAGMRMEPLRSAAHAGSMDGVEQLLALPHVAELADSMSCAALVDAVSRGHAGVAQALLAVPCVAATIAGYSTQLWQAAAMAASPDVVRVLLSSPAIRAILPPTSTLVSTIATQALLAGDTAVHGTPAGEPVAVPPSIANKLEAMLLWLQAWPPEHLQQCVNAEVLRACAWSFDGALLHTLEAVPGWELVLYEGGVGVVEEAARIHNHAALQLLLSLPAVAAAVEADTTCAALSTAAAYRNPEAADRLLALAGVRAHAHADEAAVVLAAAERGMDELVRTLLLLPHVASAVRPHELLTRVVATCSLATATWLLAPPPDGLGLPLGDIRPHAARVWTAAIDSGELERVRLLLAQPALASSLYVDATARELLACACAAGHLCMLPWLLEQPGGTWHRVAERGGGGVATLPCASPHLQVCAVVAALRARPAAVVEATGCSRHSSHLADVLRALGEEFSLTPELLQHVLGANGFRPWAVTMLAQRPDFEGAVAAMRGLGELLADASHNADWDFLSALLQSPAVVAHIDGDASCRLLDAAATHGNSVLVHWLLDRPAVAAAAMRPDLAFPSLVFLEGSGRPASNPTPPRPSTLDEVLLPEILTTLTGMPAFVSLMCRSRRLFLAIVGGDHIGLMETALAVPGAVEAHADLAPADVLRKVRSPRRPALPTCDKTGAVLPPLLAPSRRRAPHP